MRSRRRNAMEIQRPETNHESIMQALSGMRTKNNEEIPVSFMVYKGNKTTYITFQEVDKFPKVMADDECEYSAPRFDIDIYTQGNFIDIVKEVKQRLINAGWTWVEDSVDQYEADTKYFHKTATFEIENYKI